MTNSTLEDRLRSHYASITYRLPLCPDQLDDVDLNPVHTAQAGRSPRWRPRLRRTSAHEYGLVAGLGYVAFRPEPHGRSSQRPVPPQTLPGETEDREDAPPTVWTASMIEHDVANDAPDAVGGVPFSGPDNATTRQTADRRL